MEHATAVMDEATLRLTARKSVIYARRLAAVVGMTSDELVGDIQRWAAEK